MAISSPTRILFLCHSASLNGATILLLHFIQWLKTQVDWEIEVLVNGRGPLLDEFKSVCKTTIWRSPTSLLNVFPQDWKISLQPHLKTLEALYMKALLAGRRYDLIYANTGATWQQVSTLSKYAPALLWHIHELEYGLRLSIGEDRINHVFKDITKFVAVSNSVRDTLSLEFSVPYDKIDLIHGFVPLPDLTAEEHQSRRQQVRIKLGWPQDTFVVGGCGSLGWRKGTDLFLQIAHIVSRTNSYEKVRFLWVGGGNQDKESLEFDHDVRVLGLQEHCRRIITTEEISDYYCSMDMFALTSREDPFPLVMLEAGTYNVPTVCFADSGGGPEFIGDDSGLIAPYLDIITFAAHIMRLHNEPDLRAQFGKSALEKVRTHYTVECQGPKLLHSIECCLAGIKETTPYGLKH
ncbi:MAG: glycosyltransferase family 4 protein [Methylobacter sp.]|uniref:Glycosyltransferase family 4 protein n=1 Tax=Candidatus Methylobacter titanis TaxID=3053457 RepID=A0AA43Q9B1_9GAMM|nr:glycosyltransferase family 4 protein [Candidatus Methylobacter titanis]